MDYKQKIALLDWFASLVREFIVSAMASTNYPSVERGAADMQQIQKWKDEVRHQQDNENAIL